MTGQDASFPSRKSALKRVLAHSQTYTTASALAGLMLSTNLLGQGTTATLGGTVTDPSGAIVSHASILLKNEATGDQRSSISNDSGVFSFSAVPTGTYDVSITATGFRPYEQTGIHLDPGDQRSVENIHLETGSVTESVQVSSAADTYNIESGEQSSLISAEQIQHLSVEGRDVTELQKILPGFAISRGGAGSFDNSTYDPSQVNAQGALGQYAANGTPVNGQALLSDGVDITDPGAFGGALQNINYEQVAEVKVQTSSFTADTAHGPIVLNAIGKSGGEHFHGSLYTFARTFQLNSNDWIANNSGQSRPTDRYVYPGFTIGGPVLIPGTNFNHARKLTFFAGAEEYAQRNAYAYGSASTATLTALVPTAGMRGGDFSAGQLQQYLGSAYGIDPNGGGCTYNGSATGYIPDANICRVPVTAPNGGALANGNISPYLDPLGRTVLNSFPLPNTPSNGTYNYITTNLIRNDLWQTRGRLDYSASEKDKIFGSYSVEEGVSGVPQNEYYSARGNLGGVNIPGGGLLSNTRSHVGSLNYTHIFNSSLTNEFYAAAAYFSQDFTAVTQSAIANNPYQGVFNNGSTVQPTLEDYGNDGLPLLRTPDTSYGPIFARKQVRIAGDNVSKVIGQHTFRLGMFYQYDNNPQVAPFINTNGTVNLYSVNENVADPVRGAFHSTGGVGSGNGGNYLADFAEGIVNQYSQTNLRPEPNQYFWNLSGYVQDHWRAGSRWTLDYGVRFEHVTPWQDTHGVGLATFTPAAYDAGINPTLPGVQWHAINPSIPNAGRPTRWAFVNPRAGFAWDTRGTGQTILRGGGGVYRAHDAYNNASNQGQTVIGLRTYTVNGPLLLSSVSSFQSQVQNSNGFVADSNIYAFNPTDDEEPRVITYNMAVDQRIPGKMLLEIAYVGNYSDNLLNDGSTQNTTLDDLNSLPVGTLFGPQPATRGFAPGTLYPAITPAAGGQNVSVSTLDQPHIDSYKRFPLYNHVFVPQHSAYANYNGLQLGVTRQTGKGTFNVNYTWSKALGILGIGGSSTYSYPSDPFNLHNDYANLPFDRRQIFNASYSYVLGSFTNKRFLAGAVNGWEFSGITNLQTAPNLTSIISSNFGLNGSLSVPNGETATVGNNVSTCTTTAANGTCSVSVSSQSILGTADVNLQPRLIGQPNSRTLKDQYVNANAFSLPALGTNGAYRFGFLPGPTFFNTDLTAAKRFRLNDNAGVQFRAAAFNFINHANNTFTQVNTANYTLNFSQTAATAGDINGALLGSTAAGNPQFGLANLKEGRRTLELALRFDF